MLLDAPLATGLEDAIANVKVRDGLFCSAESRRRELASIRVGGKLIPGDGEVLVGALKSIPGYYVALSHTGATLGLIVGELLAYEIVACDEHPLLEAFRPERIAVSCNREGSMPLPMTIVSDC